jgi:phosphonate transport system ATP-binding protein
MRLITEICRERQLAAIVNIHDVALAQMFLPRIVGLRAGEVVYDGPGNAMTPEVLTRIYGEEDWTKTSALNTDEDDDKHANLKIAALSDDDLRAVVR